MYAPGFAEAVLFESGSNRLLSSTAVVVCLGFGWRNLPNRLKQPVEVEP